MNNQQHLRDEISILDIFSIIWSNKVFISCVTLLFAITSVIIALYLPNIYRSESVLMPNFTEKNSLASMAENFGSIAGLAGLNLGSNDSKKATQAMETLHSRKFINNFIRKYGIEVELFAVKGWDEINNKLIIDESIYDPKNKKWVREVRAPKTQSPNKEELYEEFSDILNITEDTDTGMLKLTLDYYSPFIAQKWAKLLIDDINEIIKQQDIDEAQKSISYLKKQLNETDITNMHQMFYQLIEEQTKTVMLAEVRDEYVFKTIDPPSLPDKKHKPSRALICISITVLGALLTTMFILLSHFIRQENSIRGMK